MTLSKFALVLAIDRGISTPRHDVLLQFVFVLVVSMTLCKPFIFQSSPQCFDPYFENASISGTNFAKNDFNSLKSCPEWTHRCLSGRIYFGRINAYINRAQNLGT